MENMPLRRLNDTERSLICQGDFITTRRGEMEFDSGRVETAAQITSKDP
jgi:hypothetical protein